MASTVGSVGSGPDEFSVTVAVDVRALAPMRRRVAERLATRHVAPPVVDDVLLMVSELCTNAIQATEPGAEPVVVRVGVGAAKVTIEVQNVGPPIAEDATAAQRRSGDIERGRGLSIVRALADEVTLRHLDGTSTVRAVRRLS